ncbi:alpha/beta hydrolase [Spirochaeta cellobiosiphila]|uniref:alpha/beta hydrolase n=1 Tax=Spirochaeta cellobiosiphila TaxID=504483 RepID=UPI0004139C22|nr:alpha/beta hydrolase [Spirochaeta cellobiosiphila]
MRVKLSSLNKELRPYYWFYKLSAVALSLPWMVKLLNWEAKLLKGRKIKGLECRTVYIPLPHRTKRLRLRIFKPKGSSQSSLPGMLYLHGGGYLTSLPELSLGIMKRFIETEPCIIVAPDYSKSLDSPYPSALKDCYSALLWMRDNSQSLNMYSNDYILAGHSAGGGLTAALSLKLRDTQDLRVAFQMPIYPMIDDRQMTKSSQNNNAPVWNTRNNKIAWRIYLRDMGKEKQIPIYAAPARATDYRNLPPTITFVGDQEPFLDETRDYVHNLDKGGVPTAFKIFEGCFHSFETLAPKIPISREAWDFLLSHYKMYMDQYVKKQLERQTSVDLTK